jgi:5-methylcytosine-specific restriction endonuclease McrA
MSEITKLMYPDYLRTDCWWKVVRQCCMENAKYICQAKTTCVTGVPIRCSRRATEAHHLTYIRLGHELPEDLMAVCDSCHRAMHNRTAKRELPRPANDNKQLDLDLPLFLDRSKEMKTG